MRYQDLYQFFLLITALLVVGALSYFLYHEFFPEYKTYQYAYQDLEKFRSTYTGEKPAPFEVGIKQVMIPDKKGGPETIDRCISCHVAVDLPHFSPERVVKDKFDDEGRAVLEPNPDYVWNHPDAPHPEMKKVLRMHPLIGSETRPFEYHPIEEYGCTSCHSGNGRALVANRAHGPVYDHDYEPAYATHKPQFLEPGGDRDPPISRMYNHKPGHDLIFQTTPLLAGELIVASCVQCHKSDSKKGEKKVEKLLLNYERGRELFISQACYACHRIAGFSRASVGPELTYAGLQYPWFIKESIVWPQADLPSSTMPNFRLDHEEISDLMTFLMAQKGSRPGVSQIDYQISVKEWEGGAKMPWERPVSQDSIQDVRQAMQVFVTEGCAACHKLEGFDSNVGFANGDRREERIWFANLIPDQAPGSRIAHAVKNYAGEIDSHIKEGVNKEGIIEEIEAAHPDLIEGFYSNFKFAARESEEDDYQERLKRVLKIYIKLYGMGRDIAPHLNWSGVYRDEEWLLGHFHNPGAYSPRSLMPSMPFDDTKFEMLTHMLQVLGRQNQSRLAEIWQERGFDPPLAYNMLCSPCHGVHRQGNGVIAEWIYPIPKNLRNPVFLRNLTKERAIDSILHGVAGTPMPPWGETRGEIRGEASGDETRPVLTQAEATQLVDWLYQCLPPQPRENQDDFEKWSYTIADVLSEMEREKDYLQPYGEYFETRINPLGGPDQEHYYIREKYYTAENLAQGEEFYRVNCATCHGTEGGGNGLRSTAMVEAKPRILTNLPWLGSRDDLRLLRSIKYGVPGTSMIAWGDMTTASQRMQLVIFIRELTRLQMQKEREKNDKLKPDDLR